MTAGEILQQEELESCHGIEWDATRKAVFAVGREYIQKYTYDSYDLIESDRCSLTI
jgi:hypothetical protein